MSAPVAPQLRELQRWFTSVTTQPDGVLEVEDWVTPGPQLSAAERVQIYSAGYVARLVECLTDDYPALRYALGDELFTTLARDYIAQHPSRSPSLNAYGQPLAAFCSQRSESWAAFAADLARLEWALVEVVHEPMIAGLTPDALLQIPPERLQAASLLPNPALRVLAFDYPVNEFFQAFRDDREPALPERRASATAVFRCGLSLWRLGLEPQAALLLKDLLAGVPLATAIAALETRDPTPSALSALAQQLPHWFGAWVQNGFFVALA